MQKVPFLQVPFVQSRLGNNGLVVDFRLACAERAYKRRVPAPERSEAQRGAAGAAGVAGAGGRWRMLAHAAWQVLVAC